MKLSEAIEKWLVKEGDTIEVSFKAKFLHQDGLPRLEIHKDVDGTFFTTKEMELMEWVNPVPEQSSVTEPVTDCHDTASDVVKTFKLSEAKEHLKVGMKVKVWGDDFKGGKQLLIEGKINDISSTHFNIEENNHYYSASIQWFTAKLTVKILSDPTVKDSLPVQVKDTTVEDKLETFTSRFDRRLEESEKRLSALEIDKAGQENQIASILKKIGGIEAVIKDHSERIDEREDQVQKLKKENESLKNRLWLIEQQLNQVALLQPTPFKPVSPWKPIYPSPFAPNPYLNNPQFPNSPLYNQGEIYCDAQNKEVKS